MPMNYILPNGLSAGQNFTEIRDMLLALTPDTIADSTLDRDFAQVADTNDRTLLQAARALRNKWSLGGTTYTATKEDDATPAWTSVVTSSPGAVPITGNDPT